MFILVAVLLLCGAGAVFGLGWYVGSEGGRVRIESELGKALGVPVAIRESSLGWSGLRLSGVRILADGQTFLEAPLFTARYRLGPLFHREVVLHKMVLESPQITWPQNAEGKWVLPGRTKAPKNPP